MTKRLYFTCPIKALYMMKEFGVKFSGEDLVFTDFDQKKPIYIAPESEHIFEPKKGDVFNYKTFNEIPIIMRDNKQFFAAEVKND